MLKTFRPIVAVAAIVALLHPTVALARENIHVAPWSRLAPLLAGARVTVELTDAHRLHGQALSADPSTLTIRVTRSSASSYPRGMHRIASSEIRRVTLVEPHEVTNRGTGIGVGAGAAAAAPVAFYLGASEKGPEWLGLLAIIGGAVLGGWVGHHFDRGQTVFVVTQNQNPGR